VPLGVVVVAGAGVVSANAGRSLPVVRQDAWFATPALPCSLPSPTHHRPVHRWYPGAGEVYEG